MIALVLILSALAGARTWRLLAVDTAGEPARRWMRRVTFKLLSQGKDREADLIEEGWECPFCLGFWVTGAWLFLGMTTMATGWLFGLWLFAAGCFACNFVGAQLNAWLDVKPIKDGGGEIDVMEEK